jgi:hypothetical protein
MEMVIEYNISLKSSNYELFRFCPSVFFYLCTVIPSVWFLELDLAERRSKFNVTQALGLIPVAQGNVNADIDDTLPVKIDRICFFYFEYLIIY